ncbi:MAG TPA: hypothetical protein VEX38_01425, partial [Fimbriimonadaceae bacterium]|nr:hypothetical protein [Fimbriimonadaceae bacterium]
KHWPLVQELVRKEFDSVASQGFQEEELERVKRNISGNIVLALEGMSSRMMRMAKNELHHGRDIPIEETISKINAVSNDDIARLASTVLPEARVSTTAIGPFGT